MSPKVLYASSKLKTNNLFKSNMIDVQTVLSYSSTLICDTLSKMIKIWRGNLCAHVVKTVIRIKPFMARSRFSQKELNYEYFLHLSGPVFVYVCLSLTYWIPLGNKKTGIILFGDCVMSTLKVHLNLICVTSHLYEIKFLLHISRQTQVPRRKVIIVTVYHRRPCHYFPCRLDKWDDYLSPFDMCFYAINCVWKFFSEIKDNNTKRRIPMSWLKESKYESMIN